MLMKNFEKTEKIADIVVAIGFHPIYNGKYERKSYILFCNSGYS